MKKPKHEKEEKEYCCAWCGHRFKQIVGNAGPGRKNNASSQIVCPRCDNGMRTW